MKNIKKIILVIVFLVFIAILFNCLRPIVIGLRWAYLGQSCQLEKVSASMKSTKFTDDEKTAIAFEFWNCVESRQSVIEKFFIPTPRNF